MYCSSTYETPILNKVVYNGFNAMSSFEGDIADPVKNFYVQGGIIDVGLYQRPNGRLTLLIDV